jgi:glycosyltransferase involved in cell wall biosynthesis
VVAGRAVGGSGNRIVEEMTALGARYLGEIDDNQKAKLLAGSLGVLCLEECADFGIVAVEPQLYGVPVVAYRAGGYVESVQEGISGVFVDELTVAGVNKAISEVKKRSWDKNMIARSAKKFSEESEIIYKTQGLEAFLAYEKQNATHAMKSGPFALYLGCWL